MDYIRTIRNLSWFLIRRFLRNRAALFFTFLFPVIFLVVFGSLDRGGNLHFKVAVFNNANTTYATQFVDGLDHNSEFSITKVSGLATARNDIGEGYLDGVLVLPPGFGSPSSLKGAPAGVMVDYYEQSNSQVGQALQSAVQGILDRTNDKFFHQEEPLQVALQAAKTENLNTFDYSFSGLLGFAILSLGIFGMANGFASDKANGALRRLRVSPLTSAQMIIATAIQYIVIGVLSLSLMYILAVELFHFHMEGNYLVFILFGIFSIIMVFGIGLSVAGWAKDEKQAAPLANLVGIPMMFLSGTFFPRYLMTPWLARVAGYLPLSPVIDGLRYIAAEGKGFTEILPQLGLIGAWIVIFYVLAFFVFRWE